jgi:aldose 1-epimerase
MAYTFRGSRRLLTVLGAGAAAVVLALALGMGSSAHAAGARASHKSHARKAVHSAVSHEPTITSARWGDVQEQPVNLYTLQSGHGMTVNITNYGGVIQSIWVPGRDGSVANVALGFPRLSDYVNLFQHQPWPAPGGSGNAYFGAIIGRYANRIANASFMLNGKTYHLPANNGPNTLHGGVNAWNTKVWSATPETGKGFVALKLTYTDPAGANGFPGKVEAVVTYTLNEKNALRIDYGATTTDPTVINLTNHTYFNLAGEGSGNIYDQLLQINADKFTPVNANLIPTGQFAPVAGTPFDFRTMKPIGRDILNATSPFGNQLVIAHGYDHNWVLDGSSLAKAASLAKDPASGRTLTTYTTEPGLQVYTSNFLVGDLVGTSGHIYRQGQAFTLETQHYPDTPHHQGDPNWPSVVLNPGQTFSSTTIFQFGTS